MKNQQVEKIDRRVVLSTNTLDEIAKLANTLDLDKTLNERERLGTVIESLVELKHLHDKEFINLDKISKERIQTMIGFGEYHDKEAVVKAAIENLFAVHREKIIKKIEAL